jgi:hypothetical protein
MPEYIQLPLIGDVTSLTQTGTEYMEQSMGENWVLNPANPETVLMEGAGQIAGELIDQAATVPPEALAYIGTSIYNIPFLQGVRAAMAAIITFAPDTPPVTVPADSEVAVPHPDGNSYIFTTDRDAVSQEGGNDVSLNLIALDIGADMNGAFGDCELIDVVEGVSSIVASSAAGGVDAETVDQYLPRMTSLLTLPRRPVLPEDHVTLALQVPGVGRAAVYNLYYPGTTARDAGLAIGDFDKWTPPPAPAGADSPVARCTSIAITGIGGVAPTPQLMQAVYLILDANREVNFLNFVLKPTYTSIDVRANVTPYGGTTQEDANAQASAMIADWLDPENFNSNPGTEGGVWNSDTKVRLYEAVEYLNRGGGVWYAEDVELKFSDEDNTEWRAEDLTLPGIAPIPLLGTVLVPSADIEE